VAARCRAGVAGRGGPARLCLACVQQCSGDMAWAGRAPPVALRTWVVLVLIESSSAQLANDVRVGKLITALECRRLGLARWSWTWNCRRRFVRTTTGSTASGPRHRRADVALQHFSGAFRQTNNCIAHHTLCFLGSDGQTSCLVDETLLFL
jgi:hypothetical protein